MDRAEIIARIADFFDHHGSGVACTYVFGSLGRADDRPARDVDVAVLFRKDPPSTLAGSGVGLEGDLERVLGRPVDLVVLNRAPADLVHRVLRDGALAYERDRAARVRFEVRARNEYFDLLPILDRYRRAGEARDGRR